MKNLSIKTFVTIILSFVLLSAVIVFLYFYMNSKQTIEKLLVENVQTYILNMKHFLDKSIERKGINTLKAHLDTTVASSDLIENIIILNENKRVIYSSSRQNSFDSNSCIPIIEIKKKDVFQNYCYNFDIKFHKGLKQFFYKGYVFVDKTYVNSLLNSYTNKFLLYFTIFGLFFIIVFWKIQEKIIIVPLEKLRQYAYYNKGEGKRIFIKELESIRYSLYITFERLKKEQMELYKLSTQDTLSGLYNRLSLIEKLNWLISSCERKDCKFSIIFLDLDDFKDINDSMGHNFGDKILKEVANILLNSIRENDIAARIGGDEFVVVLPDTYEELTIIEVAERIKTKLSNPIIIDDLKYSVTASMGITIYPRDGTSVEMLLKNSDIAMYQAKGLGKNNYHFFTDELNRIIQKKIEIQNIMKEALDKNYFTLLYQPKVDLKTRKIVSCEALIRLNHPKKGFISPMEFIHVAEENGFIIELGKWVIQEAVEQIKKWNNTILSNMKVSINVSAKQFLDSDFIYILSDATQGIDKKKFDIELTESVFIENFDKNLKIINSIKEMGITLSLDDFGTGYSSLSYLKKIPFNTIKIDKSFIDDLLIDRKDTSFVNMIVDIAKSLNLEVVAEGVETKEQLDYLRSIKCDLYQGYICSKPLNPDDFIELFNKVNCR